VEIAGVSLKNPVIAASGTFGFGKEYEFLVERERLGGICTKALTLKPRKGNSGERLYETASGLLNSIGLENPGIEYFLERELQSLKELGPAVIANLAGSSIEEYVEGARLLNESQVDMIELNISCPNVKTGGASFGLEAEPAFSVTKKVRDVLTGKPLMVKLSPDSCSLTDVALACINAGADALSLVNTFKAVAIDVKLRKPVFKNISAGLSGAAIKPIALRMVWGVCEMLKAKKIKKPVVGLGGISNTEDALEFLIAGSSAIQVGTATFLRPQTMTEIIDGVGDYLKTNNLLLSDLRSGFGDYS
jgi:dihydroorotate dehydrogenase (NAD+) catalytic subunit